ncbi:MAG: hypothetical protein NTY34_06930 [Candidatus Omnitrophica bacterium]|nr:hypothetical protein [Candidatus Omnitrophota bacterium]
MAKKLYCDSTKDKNNMKKCPKCGKTYDDTWKVCLSCSVALSDNLSIVETNPEIRKQQEKPLLLIVIILTSIVGLAGVLFFLALAYSLFIGSPRWYGQDYRKKFLQNIDQKSKADILQFIRNGEEYALSGGKDREKLESLEEAKKKWAEKILKKKL